MFVFFLTANLAYIDTKLLLNSFSQGFEQKTPSSISMSPTLIPSQNSACPQSCVREIYAATTSSKIISTQVPASNAPVSSSSVKDFYISFGSGSNANDDWQNVSGLQAYIDSNSYGNIKQVIFEASLHIPTGNEIAYVRLFNVTDKHPVWFSEMSLDGGEAKLLTSRPITLDPGNKLYQVQMKTQLKFTANLDQSRLHITVY